MCPRSKILFFRRGILWKSQFILVVLALFGIYIFSCDSCCCVSQIIFNKVTVVSVSWEPRKLQSLSSNTWNHDVRYCQLFVLAFCNPVRKVLFCHVMAVPPPTRWSHQHPLSERPGSSGQRILVAATFLSASLRARPPHSVMQDSST